MTTSINARAEKALREALLHVVRIEEDQITAPLLLLNDSERAEALGLAIIITSYVAIDACGSQWPAPASVQRIGSALATKGTIPNRLRLRAEEVQAYLSRVVLGPERVEDVLPESQFALLPVIVAEQALAVYCPKDIEIWEYLDRIEAAIEIASALDAAVLPAAVMLAYLPKPKAGGEARPEATSTRTS